MFSLSRCIERAVAIGQGMYEKERYDSSSPEGLCPAAFRKSESNQRDAE
jgi:hypothetical protein